MSTTSKDFKVKNGIQVSGGGSFGASITIGAPTLSTHATTKTYVDSLFSGAQPLSSNLTSIAALSGSGLLKVSGGTWTIDTTVYLTTSSVIDGGAL